MNSLSIISSTVDKVLGNTPPVAPGEDDSFRGLRRPYRRNQYHGGATTEQNPKNPSSTHSGDRRAENDASATSAVTDGEDSEDEADASRATDLHRVQLSIGRQAYMAFVNPWLSALRWIISAVAASAEWILSSLYNEDGKLSPRIYLMRPPWFRRRAVQPAPSLQFSTPENTGADEAEELRHTSMTAEHRRSRSFGGDLSHASEDISPRRSIRIRLYNEERMHQGKSSSIKSPTSPQTNHIITRYPRTSGPPVPLLSRNPAPKTLILDLDETLIHSLAKGGRLSSGHMVEVKLDKQHAILYYVHKRPYCDEFLRKVCRWYNLVIFTASVQEYADPVIDWLEQDRKYFSGRYYRQHCTNRNGAYIKDLATVEPDLSKVMIIDNSPTSYIFHEDNAIPIEGWINDPTDIDLLHLIPLLQALQYVPDVRALLALRMGESFV